MLLGKADWGACTVSRNTGDVRLTDDWGREENEEVLRTLGWDEGRAELILPAKGYQFPRAPKDEAPHLENRRGAGKDSYGNWYWIDDAQEAVLVRSCGSGATTLFWQPADGVQCDSSAGKEAFKPLVSTPPRVTRLRGLAVTSEHYLVVGVMDPSGLLIFDLHAGGPPQQLLWPKSFSPFDMAPATPGGVWILDRASGRPARLWALDRRMKIVCLGRKPDAGTVTLPIFRPLVPVPGAKNPDVPRRVAEISSEASIELKGDTVAVEGLPDGSALLLENGSEIGGSSFSRVWRYTFDKGLEGPYETTGLKDKLEEKIKPSFWLKGHDFAFVPDAGEGDNETGKGIGLEPPIERPRRPVSGLLLIVSQDGNQAYAFATGISDGGAMVLDRDGESLKALAQFWPMRLFGGKGLVASGDGAYYDSLGEWVPLVEQKHPRYDTERTIITPAGAKTESQDSGYIATKTAAEGREETPGAFDGGDPDCVWHRLFLDGSIPAETKVEVWSRAANTEIDLQFQPWRIEPAPYRRSDGPELPFHGVGQGLDSGTWETLFQSARGRFLQLRLVLRGNGRSTPSLRSLRIYYPRFSYLNRYLPAVYREEAGPASFLERFLANFEGLYTALEDRIASVQALFDSRAVPAEYLDWLAGWFDAVLDPHWEEVRKRLFIQYARQLFRERGTESGLIKAVRLATDPCPDETIFDEDSAPTRSSPRPFSIRIVERYQTRIAPGVVFGDPEETEGPGVTTEALQWSPAQGPGPLHDRYRAYLRLHYKTVEDLEKAWGRPIETFDRVSMPPVRPSGDVEANDWERFLRVDLGFTYAAVIADDIESYRDFLARRYGRIGKWKDRHDPQGKAGITRFDEIPLPDRMPEERTQLRDWIQFVSIVLPTVRNAHQFKVLVPVTVGAHADERGAMIERVRRVVEKEKPAHTLFEVQGYWAAFRVGEARLGYDSLIDKSSRLTAIALGSSYLAGGYLSQPHPWGLARRLVVGRDRVEETRPI